MIDAEGNVVMMMMILATARMASSNLWLMLIYIVIHTRPEA